MLQRYSVCLQIYSWFMKYCHPKLASAGVITAFPVVTLVGANNNLDGFSTFSDTLRAIQWPATFKPVGIKKFDGESDPKTWLRTYSIAVRAANGNNDIMAGYFPVMMSR